MPVIKGWTLTTEGLFHYASKGDVKRRFYTIGDRSDWLNQQ